MLVISLDCRKIGSKGHLVEKINSKARKKDW